MIDQASSVATRIGQLGHGRIAVDLSPIRSFGLGSNYPHPEEGPFTE